MNSEQYLIAKLADVMFDYGESRTERKALGCLYRNRAIELGWTHTLIDSSSFNNPFDPDFTQCLWDAEDVFYNKAPDITNGANSWQSTPITGATKVGDIYFYKGKGEPTDLTISSPELGYLDVFEISEE